ncbi:MAG: FAD-binding oxidoreductase [Acidimicrobiia bacterium]|nr:FAD-binding oxidoreductase [Acidimicrobiia bacterium]
METADFVVIGGGIAGAAAAYELAALGTTVLLEREAVAGYHTTGRSAALYTEAWEHGVVRSLTIASRPFLENPPPGFADYPLLSPLPVLLIGRQDQVQTVAALADDATALANVTLVDGGAAAEVCPLLQPGYVAAAILESNAMEIDVNGLHQGYLHGLRDRGGELRLNAGVDTLRRTQAGWVVTAGESTISAGVVVNAAGAWADVVARLGDVEPVGLVPYRRTAFVFPSPTETTGMPMVVDVDEEFYFKPEPGRFMGSLAEEMPMEPHDVRPEEIDVALAIDRIQAATTLEIRHVARAWAGLRSFVADRLPVVGMDPEYPGFLWLAGQGGAGIMTAPAMGALAAALATEGQVPADLAAAGVSATALAPDRMRV